MRIDITTPCRPAWTVHPAPLFNGNLSGLPYVGQFLADPRAVWHPPSAQMVEARSEGPRDSGRRRWLIGAAVGSSLLAAGGIAALVRTGAYDVAPAELASLRTLQAGDYALVRALARRLVAADDAGAPGPDQVGVAPFVDRYLGGLRARLRRDFLRMLRFTEQLAPLRCGYLRRFTALEPGEQDRVLEALEASSIDELRGGFQALKSVVMMGYYRDPRTFPILQYGGPLLGAGEDPTP